ncbi:MAG: transglycosylase SLT domain-containing protein [Treponema sp.]|nr:transglycosylase SLT domain-containing protein [Treponema sp.]MCL2252111.1 transglycosylase SLT domain-containing protein [Treponema sp.]
MAVKNFISITLISIFLCQIVTAQEGRPLRSIIPDTLVNFEKQSFVIPNQSHHAQNTLLSAYTLEQPLTQRYIAHYTSMSGINILNSVMESAALYLPFIKEEAAKRNLPMELIYLPVIESSFQITARSRSGAVGLWQFMMNSISPFNIRVTDIIDERRDFIKSTKGALQKLDENYRTLGNWELALAAYNSGLGAVSRTVHRTQIRDYWTLSAGRLFTEETIHYVPKFLAASFVLSQPRKYGINVWHKKIDWEAIPLQRQVSLDILADEAGISRELLRRLNAELLHGISPLDSSYRLKIPSSHLAQITEILERDDIRLIRYHYHVVRHGDTLWSMSRHYGTTLPMIEQHNPGVGSRYLKIGETIIIPAFNDAPPLPRIAPRIPSNFNGSHVVQKGETLWSLSRLYNVDPGVLAEANGMQMNQILHEGRTLKVPILE